MAKFAYYIWKIKKLLAKISTYFVGSKKKSLQFLLQL